MPNDVHISGSGNINGGEYKEVYISGSGRWSGPLKCTEMHVSGSAKGEGNITVEQDFHCSGSVKGVGHLDAAEIHISGAARIDGNVAGRSELHVSGGLTCHGIQGGEVSISGGVQVEKDIEADSVKIQGGGKIGGLINADTVDIRLAGFSLTPMLSIGSIGGSDICIKTSNGNGGLLRRLLGDSGSTAIAQIGTIEGDTVYLEAVKADVVRGGEVTIGKGCNIGRVECSGNLTIDTDAVVGEQVKL